MKKGWLLIQTLASRSYWKRYALRLEEQLEGEKARNQEREDFLLNAIPLALGVWAPRVREGRARPVTPLRREVNRRTPPVDSWAMLTEEERAEWPLYQADADPNQVNIPATKQEFLQMVLMRRQEEGTEVM